MKLTDELLTQLVNEELERVDEKFEYPKRSPLNLAGADDDKVKASLKKIDLGTGTLNTKTFKKIKNLDGKEAELSNTDIEKDIEYIYKTQSFPKTHASIVKAIISKMSTRSGKEYKKAFDTNMWLRQNYAKKSIPAGTMFNPNFKPSKEDINNYSVAGIQYDDEPVEPTADGGSQADAKRVDIVGFDMRNAGSESGEYPKELRHIFNAVFGTATKFTDRLKTITNFSETMVKAVAKPDAANKLKTQGFEFFMKHVMALDYITSIVLGMESGSGAYQFESFLALIAGGKVEGKSTAEAGGMGAVDFTYGDGTKGSAKYYQTAAGLEQSARGFQVNDEVHYVVALKRGDEKLNISGKPASITQLDIYYFVIKREEDKSIGDGKKVAMFKIVAPDGEELSYQEFPIKTQTKKDKDGVDQEIEAPAGKVEFSGGAFFKDTTRVGSIKLLAANTTEFKQTIRDSATKAGFGAKLNAVEDSFDRSRDMKESLVVYTSGNTTGPSAGNDLIAKHASLKASLKTLLKTLTNEATSDKLTENNDKLTEEILDNFIKQVIL